MTNISSLDQLASLMQTIGHPARLQILLAIGNGEACVCHLEAAFGWRQAYLSQHLMALREAGLVIDRRESRYIYYRLAHPRILSLLGMLADMQGISLPALSPTGECDCPNCSAHKEHQTS